MGRSCQRDTAATSQLCPHTSLALVAVCIAFGLVSWAFYIWAFRGDPGQDWMVFYTAARAYLDGNLPLIFDGERLTAALNQRFAAWLSIPLNLHPWVYPPSFLMLFLPFGLLPMRVSFVFFLLAGFGAVFAAAWLYAARGHGRWMHIFSLLLCPAVPFNVLTGQNAFFTSALLIGGFGLLNRRPALSGLLLGILTFKPQLWLMVPVALLAARRWRVLLNTGLTATVLGFGSLVLFGADTWRTWFELTIGVSDSYRAWLAAGRLNGQSVFACATLLGAPSIVANLVQGVTVALAAVCVYWIFRQRAKAELQLSALLAASILAAPHVSASDAVLLALAVTLFLSAITTSNLCSIGAKVAVAVWVSPLFNPPSVFRIGLLTPVLILIFLACVIAVIREQGESSSEPEYLQVQRAF